MTLLLRITIASLLGAFVSSATVPAWAELPAKYSYLGEHRCTHNGRTLSLNIDGTYWEIAELLNNPNVLGYDRPLAGPTFIAADLNNGMLDAAVNVRRNDTAAENYDAYSFDAKGKVEINGNNARFTLTGKDPKTDGSGKPGIVQLKFDCTLQK